jgi:hypothetical protein
LSRRETIQFLKKMPEARLHLSVRVSGATPWVATPRQTGGTQVDHSRVPQQSRAGRAAVRNGQPGRPLEGSPTPWAASLQSRRGRLLSPPKNPTIVALSAPRGDKYKRQGRSPEGIATEMVGPCAGSWSAHENSTVVLGVILFGKITPFSSNSNRHLVCADRGCR